MKIYKIILITTLLFSAIISAQVAPMITRWATANATDKQIAINTRGGGLYTYKKVNNPAITGKGVLNDELKTTINLPESGEYIIEILPITDGAPSVLCMGFTTYADAKKLKEISQWGNFSRGVTASNMLANCKDVVITATDIPNFSTVTDMSNMFYHCSSIVNIPNINQWNVSNVYDMTNMFNGAYRFNSDISSWNTSNVRKMTRMFAQLSSLPGQFNQNIGGWNTSKVTDMYAMFRSNSAFNQSLNWNTSNVTDFSGMFESASSFNQDLSNFSLAKATDLRTMFDNSGMSCANYSKTLKGWADNSTTALKLTLSSIGIKYGDAGNFYRNKLITAKNWTVSGDVYNPTCIVLMATADAVKNNITIVNPVQDILKIGTNENVSKIEIYSMSGQLVKSFFSKETSVSELQKGNYIVKVYQTDKVQTLKILKN